ncbi:MAG: hypothetical protein JWP22_1092, partial [Ramlibacter sp.]|nr:hypothetical protein [Ramlibacter sp.]
AEVGAACARQPGSTFGTYWTMVLGNRAEGGRPAAKAAPARAKAVVRAGPKRVAKPKATCGKGTNKKCR